MIVSVGLNEETFRVSTHSESSLNNNSVNKIQFWNSSRSGPRNKRCHRTEVVVLEVMQVVMHEFGHISNSSK